MIASGAKYGSSVLKLVPGQEGARVDREVDRHDQRHDDDAALAQRDGALESIWRGTRDPGGLAPGFRRRRPPEVATPATRALLLRGRTRRDRDHLRFGGRALVARFAFDVRRDRFLGHELQTRVRRGGPAQRPGHVPEEQLQRRQETLLVGLLVDREPEVAFLDQFLRRLRSGRSRPTLTPFAARPCFCMTLARLSVLPPSTAYMPFVVSCPTQ